jgi:DNA-binding transcriptional LysR family regulator
LKIQQLQYFLATHRYGSFSAAAEAMYLAQPSLAEHVRRLEEELGVKLFVRSRRLELTDAGRSLVPHAENVVASVEAARASVVDVRDPRGVASFGTFGLAYRYFLAEIIAEFAARHPDVPIRVVSQNSVQICEQIRDGELEAGLVMTPIDEAGLEVEPLMEEETVVVTPSHTPSLGPISIEQLSQMRLILYEAQQGWNDPLRRRLAERALAKGVQLEPAIEVESFDAALKLTGRGLGATMAMRSITEETSFPASLGTTPLDPPLVDSFALIYRRRAKLSTATDQFIDLIRCQVREEVPAPSPETRSQMRDLTPVSPA